MLGIRAGVIYFPRPIIFRLTVQKKFVGEHFFAVFQKIFGSEFFMDKRGLVSGSSVDNFLSKSAEKIRRGTLLCFTDFPVSKKFMEKSGGYQDLPSKIFCLRDPRKFTGEPFCAVFQEFSGNEKVYA